METTGDGSSCVLSRPSAEPAQPVDSKAQIHGDRVFIDPGGSGRQSLPLSVGIVVRPSRPSLRCSLG